MSALSSWFLAVNLLFLKLFSAPQSFAHLPASKICSPPSRAHQLFPAVARRIQEMPKTVWLALGSRTRLNRWLLLCLWDFSLFPQLLLLPASRGAIFAIIGRIASFKTPALPLDSLGPRLHLHNIDLWSPSPRQGLPCALLLVLTRWLSFSSAGPLSSLVRPSDPRWGDAALAEHQLRCDWSAVAVPPHRARLRPSFSRERIDNAVGPIEANARDVFHTFLQICQL
jgi:hypothetical protein